ncbi:MAG TPA: hypothetical protein VF942_18815 [Acidimicrobiales bacterium]
MTTTHGPKLRRGFAALTVAVITLNVVVVAPAAAHLAIRVDIRYPQPDSHVGPDVTAVVFAQQTLAGVPQTTFSASLDGHPLDPATGRLVPQTETTVIRVGTETRIPLRRLAKGRHELAIAYRPDTDMPILHTAVNFTVGSGSSYRSVAVVVLAVAMASVVALAVIGVRRRRSR